MKIKPMQDWNFTLWFLLGSVAFSVGGVSGAAFQLVNTMPKPLPKPLPLGFSLSDGWFFGTIVPLTFYIIIKIATRPPHSKPDVTS